MIVKNCVVCTLVILDLPFCDVRGGDLPAAAHIQHIAVDHANPDIVYAATIGAGLFRILDGARSWQKIKPMPDCPIRVAVFVRIVP